MLDRSSSRAFLLSCLAGGVVYPGLSALAQGTPVASPQKKVIEEVVVTAQKRKQNVQKVPAAVTVISGASLVRAGIVDATGLERVIPSAKFNSRASQVLIYIRGIGSSVTGSNVDPAVATNVNGVYVPSELTGAAFFDINRVEVIPGPQGTLFGRNSAGGTVNVISKRPDNHFGGEAYVEGGNYATGNAFAAVNIPISDKLLTRFAVLEQHHDPYIEGLGGYKNGSFGLDAISVRGSFLYTPTTSTSVYATVTYNHQGGLPNNVQNWPIHGNPFFIPINSKALDLYQDYNTTLYTLQVDQKLSDAITLTYLGGINNYDSSERVELFTAGPAVFNSPVTNASYSNEVRLTGDMAPFNWIAGLYQYHSDSNYHVHVNLPVPQIDVGPYASDNKGYAAFGQATYTVVPGLRLTGGLRYSIDQKAIGGTNGLLLPGLPELLTFYNGSAERYRIDWKLGAEYDVAKNSLLYASAQTGYNQGGYSNAIPTPGATSAVEFLPASVLAFTVGSKNRFLDDRLQLNAEAFYYDYSNYQVSARNLATGNTEVYNAKKATTYGLQLDGRMRITENDTVSIGTGILHATEDLLVLPTGDNYSGFTLPEAPAVTVSGEYTHTWLLPNGGDLDARGAVEFKSNTWGTYSHARGTYKPSYGKLDLDVTYNPPVGGYSINLFVRNLTNVATSGILNGNATPGPGGALLDPPRTFGARVNVRF